MNHSSLYGTIWIPRTFMRLIPNLINANVKEKSVHSDKEAKNENSNLDKGRCIK